jgi:tetratricopeptide (TPR) repeat protein
MIRSKRSKSSPKTGPLSRSPTPKPQAASKIQPIPLQKITAQEFANRFAHGVRISQQHFTWFFGAGCSKSSGILDAAGLVQKWLTEERDLEGKPGSSFEVWVKNEFPSYDVDNLSALYAPAFARRHPSPVERQREIEMICARGEPAYGYATLAQILSHIDYGRCCNTVLTTNFDDLIADALYLYGERHARPLVVTHEALARYVRTNSPRPTVVKLHGDAHLDPKNLQPETREIDLDLARQLYPFLQDHALIFVGYGGNDDSILRFVQNCPVPALAPPVFWVSKREPPAPFAGWLRQRNALRVDHTDFDQLMHLIRNALGINLLERNRWNTIGEAYYEAFERLTKEIEKSATESDDSKALEAATSEASKSLPADWIYLMAAQRERTANNKEMAVKSLRIGLGEFPNSVILNHAMGTLLREQGKYVDAETYYKKVIETEPSNEIALAGYALLLRATGKDPDVIESYFKRALEVGSDNVVVVGNYANFLRDIRKDMVSAEKYYKLAIEISPNNANTLGNYAQLLLGLGRTEEGLDVLERTESLIKSDNKSLHVELLIYRYAHTPSRREEALSMLKSALTAGERTPRWDFTLTLNQAKKDGHPDIALLTDLVAVASGGAELTILQKHTAWRNAGAVG